MQKNQIQPTGVLVIITWKGKFFLMERDNKPEIRNPNTWAPITGGVEENEDPTETAKRELEEEITIIPKNLKTLGINERGVGFFFSSITDEEAYMINLQEGQRYNFFKLDELSSLKLGGSFPIYLEKYKEIFKKIATENYEPKREDFELYEITENSRELKTQIKLH